MLLPAERRRSAAAVLQDAAQRMPELRHIHICRQCRDLLDDEDWESHRGRLLSSNFIEEFFIQITMLADMGDSDPKQVNDLCFSLIECMVVIYRELTLLRPETLMKDQVKILFDYFENSGHWNREDETLVNHFYYRLLPESLLQR